MTDTKYRTLVRNYLVWLVIGVTVAIAVLIFFVLYPMYSRLIQDVDNVIQERYRAEAKHIVESIATTIESMVPGGIGPELSAGQREAVKHIIRNAKFDGGKGYIYLYDIHGQCIAHGEQRDKEGKNLIGLEDSDGVRFVEELLKAAKQGGGFVRYKWATREQPDRSGKPKIGYAQMLRGDTWWLGSGVYLEDIDRELQLVKAAQNALLDKGRILLLVLLALLMLWVLWIGMQVTRPIVARMKALSRAADLERLDVAGDLHDSVAEFVRQIKTKLIEVKEAYDADTRRARVDGCLQRIYQFDDQCQGIARDIYPSVVDDHGVSKAFKYYLKEVEAYATVQFAKHIDEVPRSYSGLERALYLVGKGLVQNGLKHAEAALIEVTLTSHEERVTLRVKDNGKGFHPNAVLTRDAIGKSRFGLPWIKAQVEIYEGHVKLDSSPGCGTTVDISMPWPKDGGETSEP